MSWVAVGVAGATLVGGMMQADAAESAAESQSAASGKSIAEQRRQFNLTRQDMAPWRDTGELALGRLSGLLGLGSPTKNRLSAERAYLERYPSVKNSIWANDPMQHYVEGGLAYGNSWGAETDQEYAARMAREPNAVESADSGELMRKFTMADFQNDPVIQASMQFGLDEGRKGIERRSPLVGGYDSGATLKALTKFGTDYAGQQAGQSQARFVNDQTNQFNRLAAVSGIGQTAANTVAGAGMNSASNISNLISSQGNAQAASQIAQGNAYSNAINQGVGTIGSWWQQQQLLDQLKRQGQPGGTTTTPYYDRLDV